MAQAWKEVVRPGVYFYNDPDSGQPRKLTATPEAVKYWHDQGKAMLGAGLSVPIPLEHQPDARPLTAAERAANQLKHNAGWVKDYALRKIKDDDGKDVEALFALADITDPDIARKVSHSIRWTSPWFSSFTDGAGKEWQGVVGHLALTTRPRITRQQPFPDLSAAMSLAGALQSPAFAATLFPKGKGVALSRAGLLKGEGATLKPAYPKAFSLWQGVRLAAEDVVDEKDKKPAKFPKKPEESDPAKPPATEPKPPPEGMPAAADPMNPMAVVEESLVDPDGDISVWDVICDLLACEGYDMPEGTTGENFAEHMYRTLMDKKKADGKPPEAPMADPMTPNPNNPANAPQPTVEKPPVYMALSLEQIGKIPDPTLKNIAMSLYEQQQKNQALEKAAFNEARSRRQARLDKLLPKLQQAARDKLVAQAKDAAFSLGADGAVSDSMSDALTILEDATRFDLPSLLMNPQAALAVMPHPKEITGGVSEDRLREVVNEQLTNSGRAPVANGK